jgi:uncharacterized protein
VSAPWLSAAGADLVLSLHIQPGAKKTEVVGLHGEALKLRLSAPPVDGKANEALIAFVADILGVAKARVSLVSGASSRAKRLRVSDYSAATARQKLLGA